MTRPVRIVVVGGGISGLSTAFYLRKLASEAGIAIDLQLLERDPKPGGKFTSKQDQGYLVEGGPNGFLDNKPWTLDLVRDLGLNHALLASDDNAKRRFIFSGGKLHEIKPSPPAFLKSPLLSWGGKLRMVGELWAKKTPIDQDTSVAEFARRRLGEEALNKLLSPMVGGVFAGDPERMSLRASFPRIAELEEDYGSLIRAMLKLRKERKAAKKAGEQVAEGSGPAGPGGNLTTFIGGVSQLAEALSNNLGDAMHLGEGIDRLRFGERFTLETGTREIDADVVVLATPANIAAKLLSEIAPKSGVIIKDIPYSPVTVVGLGYDEGALGGAPEGFGFLVPPIEGRRILGCLWTSSIFPGKRAPRGKVLLRIMVGGANDHQTPGLDDRTLLPIIQQELATTMDIQAEPEFVSVQRWPEAIPMYTVGHLERLDEAEDALPAGVFLTGNAYRGVGINDCVRESVATAQRVVEHIPALTGDIGAKAQAS